MDWLGATISVVLRSGFVATMPLCATVVRGLMQCLWKMRGNACRTVTAKRCSGSSGALYFIALLSIRSTSFGVRGNKYKDRIMLTHTNTINFPISTDRYNGRRQSVVLAANVTQTDGLCHVLRIVRVFAQIHGIGKDVCGNK